MMGNYNRKEKLSIFLAKEEVKSYSELYKIGADFRVEKIQINVDTQGWLIAKRPKSSPPKWAAFFYESVDPKSLGRLLGRNSSTGAILIVPHNDRFFILSFGTGHHLIDQDKIERYFGLKASLNCIDGNCIRCIDKSSLESQPKESREQSGFTTNIQFFGIDVERDLLKAVTGKPTESFNELGPRITGRDQVQFSSSTPLRSIHTILDTVYETYLSDSYKTGPFSWVDHIGEVRDNTYIRKLEEDLFQRLTDRKTDKVWLSVPEIINWENTFGFKYLRKSSYTKHDVNLEEFLDELPEGELTKEVLKSKRIFSVDENRDPIQAWPAYRFLYAESQTEEGHFILNNGKWYRIENDYAKSIEDFYKSIQRYDESLPEYDDNTETEYNARIARENTDKYFLLDRKNIKISAQASPVEPCDILKYPDEFIHIKRYGGSSVLSHLFNQGLVSGELFKREPDFASELVKKIGDKITLTKIQDDSHSFRVVFAIVSEFDEDLSIPFFSKISIKHAVSRLGALGYTVFLARIPVAERKKKTKYYDKK